MSPWTIRRFEGSGDADYETLARLRTLTEPEYPVTAGEIRRHDALRDPRARAQRWLADDPATGETVGSGGYGQGEWNYHPQRFMVGVTVRPDRLNRGVATALYETITAALAPLDPLSLRAHCREDRDPAVDFLTRHGFAETMREWESRLNVAAFDLAPFAGADARVAEEGITIRTLAELKREIGDETALRKLWELDNTCSADAPFDEPFTGIGHDAYVRRLVSDPHHRPDAFFIAVAPGADEWAGVSMLFHRASDDHLDTGLTGVRRAWRRKGIALALKLRAIAYAQSVGAPVIRTENATTNQAMLSINEALGFAKQPAWITFVKRVGDEQKTTT